MNHVYKVIDDRLNEIIIMDDGNIIIKSPNHFHLETIKIIPKFKYSGICELESNLWKNHVKITDIFDNEIHITRNRINENFIMIEVVTNNILSEEICKDNLSLVKSI